MAKGLVKKVNSLYQSSKNIIKNPKKLAVPLALGLALNYSSRINAGTISDTFADGIWDFGGAI